MRRRQVCSNVNRRYLGFFTIEFMATSCPLGFVPACRQHCQKQESVKIQQEGLALVNHRHEGGIASGLDLAQQQTLLDSTVTQLYLLQQQRAQFEHAIAVLTGSAASTLAFGSHRGSESRARIGRQLPRGSLSSAAESQNAAVTDAHRALDIANDRYVGGLTTFLDVIIAQSVLLTNQRLSTQLLGQQMVTSVYLVKALGGGWDASAIQSELVHPTASQKLQP